MVLTPGVITFELTQVSTDGAREMDSQDRKMLAGERIRSLRSTQQPRPWTQDRLVYELRSVGLRANLEVPSVASCKVQVSRWENGHSYPDERNRELLRLAFRTTDEVLGFSASQPNATITKQLEPVPFQSEWRSAFDQAASDWGSDMERRDFLQGAAFTAAASTFPAFQWLVGDSESISQDSGTVQVGQSHVETIRHMTRTFRTLDNRFGGGQSRETVIRYLANDVAPLVHDGRYSGKVGHALLSASAEALQLAGWMTYDAGRHGLGQRYMTQALRLALAADDAPLGGEILAGLSHQASYLHDSSTAVDLARAAAKTARRHGLDALLAEASVMEAHGHASGGDEAACAKALAEAETALDRADRSADPEWIGYFDEAYLSAKFGHCFKELRQAATAAKFAERSLDMDGSYVRGRSFNLLLLATAHAQAGEVEAACAVGDEAVGLVQGLQSERANEYVRVLQQELVPYETSPTVQVFNRGVAQALAQAI